MPRDIRGFEPLPPSDNSPFPDPSPDEIGVWSGPDVRIVIMQRMTGCPDCGVAVPVGRWCNRCGARLDTPNVRPAPAISVPHLGQFAALVLSLMLVITVVQFAPTVDGGALGGAGGDVALPATSDLNDPPFVPYRTVMWATVVCSSIDLRQVPLRQIGGADIGELVALPVGDCVVHARPQAGRAGVGTASLAR